jgi:hypothetical protein
MMRGFAGGVVLLVAVNAVLYALWLLQVGKEAFDWVSLPAVYGASVASTFLAVRRTQWSAWLIGLLMALLATLLWVAAAVIATATGTSKDMPLVGGAVFMGVFGAAYNTALCGVGAGLGVWSRRRSLLGASDAGR